MSQEGDSGEKTENATPKRLRDARKKGDIPKSKDLSNTLGLAFTLTLLWMTFAFNLNLLTDMLSNSLAISNEPFDTTLKRLGGEAISVFMTISVIALLPVAIFGMIVEFLQTGPLFALEKVMPKLSNLSLTDGIKKMFSTDNMMEVIKAISKTIILFVIAYFVVQQFLGELMLIPGDQTITIVLALKTMLIKLLLWTLGIFLAIMALDFSYQHYSFAKKMRMSMSDIKQEHKDSEGDPTVKNQRKQMHQEMSQESSSEAARSATALVVNPTHVAIAIYYDKEESPVPVVSAKGEGATARQMRDAANENHVPVLRNERLARTLLANTEEGDVVPRALFDIVAEVILWANKTSAVVDRELGHLPAYSELEEPPEPPGENLTAYPDGFDLLQIFPRTTQPGTVKSESESHEQANAQTGRKESDTTDEPRT